MIPCVIGRSVLSAVALSFLVGCSPSKAPTASPPKAAASGLLEDVYPSSGISFTLKQTKSPLSILQTIGHGVGIIDFDEDGLYDVILAGHDKIAAYKNLGDMKFADVTAKSGLKAKGFWGGPAVGDIDNDGHDDLYISGYDCVALYRGNGKGAFEDITSRSGLEVKPIYSGKCPEWRSSAGFVDYDRDGWLDLYVCRYAEFGPSTPNLCGGANSTIQYSCSPDVYEPQRGSLYQGAGNGKFVDRTKALGLHTSGGRSLGVAFGDYNDDGLVDIAVANDGRAGDLFTNHGKAGFKNDGVRSGTAFNAYGHVHGGMGIDWGDYNADGKLDLFVTTYQNEAKCLYRNLGKGVFTDGGLDAGLAERMDRWVSFGAKFVDFNRDGKEDLIVTSGHVIDNTAAIYPGTVYKQPVQVFYNKGGAFDEVTDRLAPSARRLAVGRGLATVDLDNDGLQDAIVTDHDGSPMILHNQDTNTNRWISLKLRGTKSGRDAFGARMTVTSSSLNMLRTVSNAGGYMSANDPRQFFGLGDSDAADVGVVWPSGLKQQWNGLKSGRFYTLTEGKSETTSTAPLGAK